MVLSLRMAFIKRSWPCALSQSSAIFKKLLKWQPLTPPTGRYVNGKQKRKMLSTKVLNSLLCTFVAAIFVEFTNEKFHISVALLHIALKPTGRDKDAGY